MKIIGQLGGNVQQLLKFSEHTIPRNLSSQIWATNDSDDDEDDDVSDDEAASGAPVTPPILTKNQPYAGLGFFFYLLLVKDLEQQLWPSVISPEYALEHILPFISGLLLHSSQRLSPIGLDLHNHLLQAMASSHSITIPANMHKEWAMITRAPPPAVNHPFLFLQVLLNWLVQCPNEKLRKQGHTQFKRTMTLFCASSRFTLYVNLLKTSPYPQINAVLIHCIKEEVEQAYYGDSPDPDAASYFAGPKLLDLLPVLMNADDDVMNYMDQIVAALNFYRYLLIKDKTRKSIGVCTRTHARSVKQGFITHLQTRTRELLRSYQLLERDDPESVRKHEEATQMLGLPPLSPEENRQQAGMAITSLLLLEDLLTRVDELIAENENE